MGRKAYKRRAQAPAQPPKAVGAPHLSHYGLASTTPVRLLPSEHRPRRWVKRAVSVGGVVVAKWVANEEAPTTTLQAAMHAIHPPLRRTREAPKATPHDVPLTRAALRELEGTTPLVPLFPSGFGDVFEGVGPLAVVAAAPPLPPPTPPAPKAGRPVQAAGLSLPSPTYGTDVRHPLEDLWE